MLKFVFVALVLWLMSLAVIRAENMQLPAGAEYGIWVMKALMLVVLLGWVTQQLGIWPKTRYIADDDNTT